MLAMLQDLVRHKNYANALLLNAIAEYEVAAADAELRGLLHHVILANRFWLFLLIDCPFDTNRESLVPESLRAVAALYRETQEKEIEWITGLRETELERRVVTPFLLDQSFSIPQALMQVCLHSYGHRAQCIEIRKIRRCPKSECKIKSTGYGVCRICSK